MIEYATNENGVVELKPIPSQYGHDDEVKNSMTLDWNNKVNVPLARTWTATQYGQLYVTYGFFNINTLKVDIIMQVNGRNFVYAYKSGNSTGYYDMVGANNTPVSPGDIITTNTTTLPGTSSFIDIVFVPFKYQPE